MEIYNPKDFDPFEPSEKGSKVLWTYPSNGAMGIWYFTFDKVHLYNFWSEYPYALTKEQKELFDKENPYKSTWRR